MGQTIKVQSKAVAAVVVVSEFHKAVARIALAGIRAAETNFAQMRANIRKEYGDTCPTFEQYRADHAALKVLAKLRGLEDAQVLRKAYNRALKAEYEDQLKGTENGLPEAQTAEAIVARAKRAKIKAAAAALEKAEAETMAAVAKAQAPAADTGANERTQTEAETIECVVTRLGMWNVLDACIAILAADELTKAQALHLRRQADVAKAATEKAKQAA